MNIVVEIGMVFMFCMLLVMMMLLVLFMMVWVVKCIVCCDELYCWLTVVLGMCLGKLVVSHVVWVMLLVCGLMVSTQS